MPYHEWNGDWCRRQSAKIDEAELYLFPLKPSNPAMLQQLCNQRVNAPSGGRVGATPWQMPITGDPIVLLVAARFSGIRSGDPAEALKGYLDEHDIGFFVPVDVTSNGAPQGVFALNPYLYVDNPAGVIMGREIFGFPKIEGQIGWDPSILEFDLRSLVFTQNTASTLATQELVLSLRRSPWLSWLAPLLGWVSSTPLQVIQTQAGALASAAASLAQAVLGALGVVAPKVTAFTELRLPLLKQYRSALPGTATAYQDVVKATFDLQSLAAFSVVPSFLFWLSPLELRLYPHASVDIAQTLGLDAVIPVRGGFRVECKLELTGSALP